MSKWWIAFALIGSLGIAAAITTPASEATAQSSAADDAMVERGRYLVHDAAMCVQCHSPRNNEGEIIRNKWMRGGSVWVDRPSWSRHWASHAPDVVALARGRTDYLVTVLTTGKRPDGSEPMVPMPPYRLSEEDAEAVVAYLKTLR